LIQAQQQTIAAIGERLVAGAGFEPARPKPEQLPDYEPSECKPVIE